MPRKKIKGSKKKKIKTDDLLPESREFFIEKELEKEKKKRRRKETVEAKSGLTASKAVKPLGTEDDSHKRLAMWTGVIFFMVLIFFIWVYNIKATFRAPANNNKESDLSWDKISEDFKKTMGEVKENITDLKSAVQTATTTEENKALSKEEIEKLKEKLMVNNIGTSSNESEVATSSSKR